VGIVALIIDFTTRIFDKNIVIGGRPPIFLTTKIDDQKGSIIFSVFLVIIHILFKVAIIVDA